MNLLCRLTFPEILDLSSLVDNDSEDPTSAVEPASEASSLDVNKPSVNSSGEPASRDRESVVVDVDEGIRWWFCYLCPAQLYLVDFCK